CCLNICSFPVRFDSKRTALLSRIQPLGESQLSLTVRRRIRSRRVPFALSSPTYTSNRLRILVTARWLPSLLTLGNTAFIPYQFVIFARFPEAFPVRGSAMISQRL